MSLELQVICTNLRYMQMQLVLVIVILLLMNSMAERVMNLLKQQDLKHYAQIWD